MTYETQLREGLSVADDVDLRVDADAVLALGRTAVRRRRWSTGLGVATAGVVAVVAITTLGQHPRPAQPAPVGAPTVTASPATAPTAGYTIPAAGASAEILVTEAAGDRPREIGEPDSIVIGVTGDHDDPVFSATARDAGGRVIGEDTLIEGGPVTRPIWSATTLYPGYVVGVIPDRVERFEMVLAADAPSAALITWHEPLGDTGLTAIVVRLDDPTYADRVTGLLWLDDAGAVRSTSGEAVATTFETPNGPAMIVLDEALDHFAVWHPAGGLSTRPSTHPDDEVFWIVAREGGSTFERGWTAGVLPAGSRDIAVENAAGMTDVWFDVTALPDGRVAYLVTGSGSAPQLVAVLTWRDQSEETHTATP